MKCPNCGNPDAYQGLMSLDCPNNSCRYFAGNKSVATIPVPTPPTAPTPAPAPIAPGLPSNPNQNLPNTGPTLSVTIL